MFAIEAVLDIAYNARPDPVQSKDITKRLGIPQRYLEQVMQRHILHVLDLCDGNRAEAARRLGVSRKTIDRRVAAWEG